MFKATRPFKDTITGYDKEPSLRIGNKVPQNAVNLAYYYNPTATDSEKVLAADPPRQTIDHRIETQWLTKLDQASGPNGEEPSIDLFPQTIYYSDEEGYYGRLKRQDETVRWYPEKHVDQKEITQDNVQIVEVKGDEDKVIEYSDASGYRGNLYLDTSTYESYTTEDVTTVDEIDYSINNFELNYHEIFGTYLNSDDIKNGSWTNEPNPLSGEDSCWPARIELTPTKLNASDGSSAISNTHNRIANYVNNLDNNFEGSNEYIINNSDIMSTSKPIGFLYFDKLEYEPVKYDVPPQDGSISNEREITGIISDEFNWETNADNENFSNYTNVYPGLEKVTINGAAPKTSYLAYPKDDNYQEIEDFMVLLEGAPGSHNIVLSILQDAIDNKKDIAIWLSDLVFHIKDETIPMLVDGSHVKGNDKNEIDTNGDPSACYFELKFKYNITDSGTEGTILYNVIANYHTITLDSNVCSVRRTLITRKEIATSYRAYCHYSGLANKNWIDYDGIAFYMGSVTKGNSIGNMNASDDNELLMFPNKDGYLRQIVEGIKEETDENNRPSYSIEYRNYYRIETDTVYVTDVFKDNEACFYKYRLKQPIYDYRGPDTNGFYQGDAVKIYTSTLKDVPDNYKHNIKLSVAEYEEKTTHDQYNRPVITQVPKCYYADLFTSFISSSTDTFKAIYNGFNDIDNDNTIINNGIEEDIYNAPYMVEGVDYELKTIDKRSRLSQIQILNYEPLKDTRYRVSFSWKVKAINKENGLIFESEIRFSSILNKDYCIPCEYSQFEDRGMIISPKLNGDSIPCSPRDLCLHDQAGYQSLDNDYEPIINDKDDSFIYSVIITEISKEGSVNIKCNPDGSGVITAETTVDTGFYNEVRSSYTNKLDIENPYWTDGEYIYQGYKVKCIDSRDIKVKAPRENNLLESWYPLIQFGHFSRIIDQYGSHQKVCYSMPEYDYQHYSTIYQQPYVDISNEQVTIVNSHMIKTKCYPLLVLFDNNNVCGTIHVFKKIDTELFELEIENISFSDGIIILKNAISESDNIIANYTYLEENYQYRGYWRDESDFVRIDLNPNIYHTYNNPNYLPSEVSPSKNLFNKVIYFFMKPNALFTVNEDNGNYYDANKTKMVAVQKTRTVTKYRDVERIEREFIIEEEKPIMSLEPLSAPYSPSLKEILSFTMLDNYHGKYTVTMSNGHWFGFRIEESEDGINYTEIARNDKDSNATHNNNIPLSITIDDVTLEEGKTYRIRTRECSYGSSAQDGFLYTFNVDTNFNIAKGHVENVTYVDQIPYEDVEEYTDYEEHYLDEEDELISEVEYSLYHKIDDPEPNDDSDMLLGSVYIRQDTSLHSTIITDSRTRGGGVLEAMSDSLRHELEPESDFYLDIGYYDGKPYQENGVIIVRLDNRILKEYGGRFTISDVEQRVKRWLGLGIYPIIEFVDSYKKEDLPQYTLEVEDSYTNVIDITPVIYGEDGISEEYQEPIDATIELVYVDNIMPIGISGNVIELNNIGSIKPIDISGEIIEADKAPIYAEISLVPMDII